VGGDQPVVVTIVDSAENVARMALAAEGMMATGMMAISEVQARRVEKRPG
jgi:PII-like signaling protein